MRAEQLEWVDADRQARRAVVGEHPLPHRRLGQLRRGGRRLERQRGLLWLSWCARDARGAGHEAELREELPPPQPEAVAGARLGERAQLVLRQPRLLRELANG